MKVAKKSVVFSAVVLALSPAPFLNHISIPSSGSNDSLTIIQASSRAVHITRTTGASQDMMSLAFDRVHDSVEIAGAYWSSRGGELIYRAQMTRGEGYVEISSVQERFAVRFVKRGARAGAYTQLVSVSFGDREVAVDEQQLERNLPQLIQIAEALAQSRMLPMVLDAQSLIRAAREKIAQGSARERNTSFGFMREVLAAGCGFECVDCGVSLVAYGLSTASLFAACGASFGVGCILAVVEGRLAAISIVLSCADCIDCLF